jgi:signal peptidase II
MHDMQIQAGAPLIPSPGPNEHTPEPSRPRRQLYLAVVIVAVPVYVADQLTKAWAAANLRPDQPRELIGSVLRLNLIRNSGAAFSIGTGATWVLTAIACSVVVFVVITARRLGSRGWAVALGLLLAGSLGNLTDRMFRAPGPGRGEVVDFVQLPHYPIFNIADSAIVSAAVLIALMAFRGVSIDGTREPRVRPGREGPANGSPRLEAAKTDGPAGKGQQIDRSESETSAVEPPHPPTGTDRDV